VFQAVQCAAVIPCYNEAASIAALVSAVRQQLPVVIVVDDGSTDNTGNLAQAAGATVIRHPHNLGKGASLKTGLTRALNLGYEWVATLDGDGQHAPEDLPALFQAVQATDARLIIGNRMGEAQKMCRLRRLVNRWMSRQLSRRAGCDLPDTQSGFRLIHLRTWAELSLQAQHFEVESETLMAFLAAGQAVQFAPVRVMPGRRQSHIHPVADTVRWFQWWRKSHRHLCPPLNSPSPSTSPSAGPQPPETFEPTAAGARH